MGRFHSLSASGLTNSVIASMEWVQASMEV
ncbi:hypothetical protein SMF913_14753 [Streptomyces malaysiensis]|uniref:Uncharacterized protein n=1 Tax=Streptomyces malaysiensis TaxID=92644 RepID=A0A2J7ZEP3_STRMQ|nr:hypothetical protein SMF913_14753 [Streptomyces malaysiensis]